MEQLAARRAHNPKVGGSSPPPATKTKGRDWKISSFRFNILEDRRFGFFQKRGQSVCMRFAQRRQKEDKHSAVNFPPATTADKSKDLSAFSFRDCFENAPRL